MVLSGLLFQHNALSYSISTTQYSLQSYEQQCARLQSGFTQVTMLHWQLPRPHPNIDWISTITVILFPSWSVPSTVAIYQSHPSSWTLIRVEHSCWAKYS